MGDEDLVTATTAAADVKRPAGTVRAWACAGKFRPVEVRGMVNYFRLGDVRALAREMDSRPGTAKIRAGRKRGAEHEPTEEEIEIMVAEQMQPENLPLWWHHERGSQ